MLQVSVAVTEVRYSHKQWLNKGKVCLGLTGPLALVPWGQVSLSVFDFKASQHLLGPLHVDILFNKTRAELCGREDSTHLSEAGEDTKIFSRNIRIFVYYEEVTQRISKCAIAIGIQRWHLHTGHAPPLLPCSSTRKCWSDHQIETVDARGSGKWCLLRNSFTSGCDIIS